MVIAKEAAYALTGLIKRGHDVQDSVILAKLKPRPEYVAYHARGNCLREGGTAFIAYGRIENIGSADPDRNRDPDVVLLKAFGMMANRALVCASIGWFKWVGCRPLRWISHGSAQG